MSTTKSWINTYIHMYTYVHDGVEWIHTHIHLYIYTYIHDDGNEPVEREL